MKKFFLLAFIGLVSILGCSSENQTLVIIAGESYTVGDFKEHFQFMPTDDSLKKTEKVNDFIDQMVLIKEAQQRGYEDDPVVQAAYDTHRKDILVRGYYNEKLVKKIKIPDSELRKIYEQIIDQYHLSQIVVANESLANFIEESLKTGASFDSLLQFSLDTLTPGGDIGTFSSISIPPEILKVIAKAKVGDVTKPIKFGDYFYCFKVIEHQKGDVPKFDDIKERIKNNLLRERLASEGEDFAKKIIEQAKVEYNDEGIKSLLKPDSLVTDEDLNKWVVKKYDTAFVLVRTIRDAVRYQYQQSFIDPKLLIERELFPDLLYDMAIKENIERLPDVKKNLKNALSSLMYQKIYSDEVIAQAEVDSIEVLGYYKNHSDEYKDKNFKDVYKILKTKLRSEKIQSLKENLLDELRKKYEYKINEGVLAKLLKGAK